MIFLKLQIALLESNDSEQPKYILTFWSVAKADTKRIYPRTPNSVESWHRRVNHIIGKTHIGIYKFISKLKLEFINAKTQICRI